MTPTSDLFYNLQDRRDERKKSNMDLQQIYIADHNLRTEQVNLYKAQNKQMKENAERSRAEAQAKRIRNCDGSSTQRLRQWFRDIEITVHYSASTVYIATLTADGPLRMEIEKYLATLQNRNRATWADVRRHLQNCFMSQHEEEKLRDDLEKICRQPYEATAPYGRRFSEAADLAYPAAQRNADQQKTMLRRYMKGLGDERLVLRLIQERDPADYLEAIEAVAKFESDAYQVYRAVNGVAPPERQVEPMDISAIRNRARGGATGSDRAFRMCHTPSLWEGTGSGY